MGRMCLIKNCTSKWSNAMLHRFPPELEAFLVWKKAIMMDIKFEDREKYRICDLHFNENMKFEQHKKRTNLKCGAYPTLLLFPIAECFQIDNIKEISTSHSTSSELPKEKSQVALDIATCSTSTFNEELPESPRTPPDQRPKIDDHTPRCLSDFKQLDLKMRYNRNRSTNLTPTSKSLFKVAKNAIKVIKKLDKKNVSNLKMLERARQYAETYGPLENRLNKTAFQIIATQAKIQKFKPKGRRYNMQDKIFALSLLKQSPKSYRFMQKFFALPSRNVLVKLLNKLPFQTGISKPILMSLKKSTRKMKPSEKKCVILLDEMTIDVGLAYNYKNDEIIGAKNLAQIKSNQFADHVLVVMARGIIKKWKQPIAYYFSDSGITAIDLKAIILQNINAMQEAGLDVVATICDQLSANCSAFSQLCEDTKRAEIIETGESKICGFKVNNKEIIPLFDPPHLLKGVRNNFLDKKIEFVQDGVKKIAEWNHIIQLYELDKTQFEFSLLHKLTESHVYTNKIRKMKVSYAAQVFSHRVASTLHLLVEFGNNIFPIGANHTADILLFFDKLFDSVNGSSGNIDETKFLKSAITPKSMHINFWREAVKVLDTMVVVDGNRRSVPPSFKNWIKTLKGFIYLCTKLQAEKIPILYARLLNQDPLENFFGCIRAHGARNVNPTCDSFVASFKTLIINNFLSTHSPHANCEQDESDGLLSNLQEFIEGQVNLHEENFEDDNDDDGNFNLSVQDDFIRQQLCSYLGGYISRQILKKIDKCNTCRSILLTGETTLDHRLIIARCVRKNALLQPTTYFTTIFKRSEEVCHYYIEKYWYKTHLKQKLIIKLKQFVPVLSLCDDHMLGEIFYNKFAHFFIATWVKSINKILKGLTEKNINSQTKKNARERFVTYRSRIIAINKSKSGV